MIYNEIKCVVENFKFEGEYIAAEELTAGNINNIVKQIARKNFKNFFIVIFCL
jgi:acyl CoA:acetate/3-ketoacid CoA transferase alpha subunit